MSIKTPAKPSTPKYRISARHEGRELPHAHSFAANKAERAFEIESMAKNHPDCIIEVRLLKGFRHRFPVRWRLNEKKQLEVVSHYDQIAVGKRPPTEKQMAKARTLQDDI